MDNKKKIILSVLVVLLLLVVGVTYAFFTYESGTKSDIVTGQIYMNYEETSTISLTGVFPETKEQALARQDENGVFEFTITGRNTSKYPVYYEIDLLEGGVITGKTATSTKILPEHVRIYLERDGEPLVDGMAYKDWNNRRIYVDTVPANQTSNIEHKYTLRMWIDENVTISDTDPNANYTTSEWNDAYTSLKVRVVGDFEYKDLATNVSCFGYRVAASNPNIITYDYPIITLDTSEEKVNTCKDFMLNTLAGGKDYSDAQDGFKAFCEGTGTAYGGSFLKDGIANEMFTDEQIQSLGVVKDITYETKDYELNTSEESVIACMEYMLNDAIGIDISDANDGYYSFCKGTGTFDGGYSIFDVSVADLYYDLIGRNVLTPVEEIPQVIQITGYDTNCGTDVIIPSQIEGLLVTRIAGRSDLGEGRDFGAFGESDLISIEFPNTLKYIGDDAFVNNQLTNVVIPDSVIIIGESAFSGNKITDLEIGAGVKTINQFTFYNNPLINVNVKGEPSLGDYSFVPIDGVETQTFQYGGTCRRIKKYVDAFYPTLPQVIITSDDSSCEMFD